MSRVRSAPIAVAACLLAGCGAPATHRTAFSPERSDSVILRLDGKSRVVFRTGETETAYRFELRDGTATRRTRRSEMDWGTRTARTTELRAVQVETSRGSAGVGALLGFAGGSLLGAASMGDNPAVILGVAFGGVTGAAVGGLAGSTVTTWKDRYVFHTATEVDPRCGEPAARSSERSG